MLRTSSSLNTIKFFNLKEIPSFSYGGTYSGMLIKWIIEDFHVKTGRRNIRGFLDKSGIEPVIEVLVYSLGVLLGINVAHEELGVCEYLHHGERCISIVNYSKDFTENKELYELEDLVRLGIISSSEFTSLRKFTEFSEVYNLAFLDLLILNEDRHNRNVAFIYDAESAEYKLSPSYDQGYSFFYDDVRGLTKDFKKASLGCPCNSEIYGHSFRNLENIVATMNKRIRDGCEYLQLPNCTREDLKLLVETLKLDYNKIINMYSVDNLSLGDEWFNSIFEFLVWRLDYVRNL